MSEWLLLYTKDSHFAFLISDFAFNFLILHFNNQVTEKNAKCKNANLIAKYEIRNTKSFGFAKRACF